MCVRTLEQARKFSASNLLDLELGVKYEKQRKQRNHNFKGFFS